MGVYLGNTVYNDSQVTEEFVRELIEKNGKGVFFAEYAVTRYNDVLAAYNDGKAVFLKFKQYSQVVEKYGYSPLYSFDDDEEKFIFNCVELIDNETDDYIKNTERIISRSGGWTLSIIQKSIGTALFDRQHNNFKYEYGNLVTWAFGAPLLNFSGDNFSYNLCGLPNDCLSYAQKDANGTNPFVFLILGAQVNGAPNNEQKFRTLNLQERTWGGYDMAPHRVAGLINYIEIDGDVEKLAPIFVLPTDAIVFGPWNSDQNQQPYYNSAGFAFWNSGGYWRCISDGAPQAYKFTGSYTQTIDIDLSSTPNSINQKHFVFTIVLTAVVKVLNIRLPGWFSSGTNNAELQPELKLQIECPFFENTKNKIEQINITCSETNGHVIEVDKPVINEHFAGAIVDVKKSGETYGQTYGDYGTDPVVIVNWESVFYSPYITDKRQITIYYNTHIKYTIDELLDYLNNGFDVRLKNVYGTPSGTYREFYDVAGYGDDAITFISRSVNKVIRLFRDSGWQAPEPYTPQ